MTKKKNPNEKRGRPSVYTEEVVEHILAGLMAGRTLKSVCRDEGMPDESTVRLWAMDDYNGFYPLYAKAREIGYQVMADELLEISDDGSNDWMEREGKTTIDAEHLGRSRLRVDTRKWLLAKALPKVYGDKLALGGVQGEPIETKDVSSMTEADLAAKIAELQKRAKT